jgi:hypothetical protein
MRPSFTESAQSPSRVNSVRSKMRRGTIRMSCAPALLLIAVVLAFGSLASAQRVTGVEPLQAKAGDTVTAKGDGLSKADVDVFYLTDGKTDWKCQVVEQTATGIKFKVPDEIKSGRWAVMIHTTKDQLIELPVKLNVP